jgi:hypothetical protein
MRKLRFGFIRSAHQRFGFRHRQRDRFFEQHRHAGGDALQRVRHVQRVRCGQHHAVGLGLVEQLGERGVQRHAGRIGMGFGGGGRIDYCAEFDRGARARRTDVRQADVAGAGNGDARSGLHGIGFLCSIGASVRSLASVPAIEPVLERLRAVARSSRCPS